jgi:hypothetical protein
MAFDANLVGTWKIKGAVAPHSTYRVDSDGRYHAAGPARTYHFESNGTVLNWDGITYTKRLGTPGELVGVWDADSGGEEWTFRSDGTVTIHFSAADEWFGNYESRAGDTMLWYEEFRSVLSTNGPNIEFDPPYAANQAYHYTLVGDNWTLKNPATGTPVAEFERL